ncbi:hypothetical protein CDL15_Pgr003428 [Punica granatum]|uniref:PGG domain-containing protein n=1 Tax=Punica granatum TaxID=22663 RepID=A0A218X3J1_PUNGR|nr:hypothetical protein CDL15_Pgr003428 [Punica granatum]PKI39296.1 hypothetical protein CRG98_040352 [Punica granatum]
MVSSIIATCPFQAAIALPGGVWQNDTNMAMAGPCSDSEVCAAGNAVLAYYSPEKYYDFMKYNMVSFLESLVVLFLVISGFPIEKQILPLDLVTSHVCNSHLPWLHLRQSHVAGGPRSLDTPI